MEFPFALVQKEVVLSASRSDGPGGQAVNKVNSKVTLRFDVKNSKVLNDELKAVLLERLSGKLTSAGVLVLTAQEHRSQLENRQVVSRKFEALLRQALVKRKKRKRSKPPKSAKENRISEKKRTSEKKQWRRTP
jgi:ribosome-associated protein